MAKKKKAKGKIKIVAPRLVKTSAGSKNEPVDMVQVRENIDSLVGVSAEEIAKTVIEAAKKGQLASVKYLFESVGLYPAMEETKAKAPEDSLAYALLRRLGLPTEPVICEEDPRASVVGSDESGKDARRAKDGEEDRSGEGVEE